MSKVKRKPLPKVESAEDEEYGCFLQVKRK